VATFPEPRETGTNARGNGAPVRSELLREVNERIREVGRNGDFAMSGLEFVCECGGGDCVAMVELTVEEYEGLRLGPGFVLAAGHAQV
jgi:hypothetical protein